MTFNDNNTEDYSEASCSKLVLYFVVAILVVYGIFHSCTSSAGTDKKSARDELYDRTWNAISDEYYNYYGQIDRDATDVKMRRRRGDAIKYLLFQDYFKRNSFDSKEEKLMEEILVELSKDDYFGVSDYKGNIRKEIRNIVYFKSDYR